MAESYFFQLFELSPNAYISDLRVSSAIQNLFEKTKERFLKESREFQEFDEFGHPRVRLNAGKGPSDSPPKQDTLINPSPRKNPDPSPTPRKQPTNDAKIRVWPWVLGGVAIAAAGGLWWYSSQEKSGKNNNIPAQ
ncbi:MAG: hypothetical protein ABIY63_01770 [Fibrobacteria bacterium]